MNCNDAVGALVASLENGTALSEEQREHIRTCERCRELLDSAKQFEASLSANGVAALPLHDDAIAVAEGEVLRNRARRMTGLVIAIGAIFAAMVVYMFMRDPFRSGEFVELPLGVLAFIFAGFAVPVLLVIFIVRDSARRRMYKRLKPGRMLAGVCLGLSERVHMDVLIVRVIFIALLFVGGGIGFWLYIALNVAMPVHPDDRQYLLRFRLRRWFEQRNRHADYDAG